MEDRQTIEVGISKEDDEDEMEVKEMMKMKSR